MVYVTQGCQYLSAILHRVTSHQTVIYLYLSSILHIWKQLILPIFRNLCLVQGAEDGGSKLLLVIHYFDSSFTCLQVGENTGTLNDILCCRGYVQSLKKSGMLLDNVQWDLQISTATQNVRYFLFIFSFEIQLLTLPMHEYIITARIC
jgi:hypothetical protein